MGTYVDIWENVLEKYEEGKIKADKKKVHKQIYEWFNHDTELTSDYRSSLMEAWTFLGLIFLACLAGILMCQDYYKESGNIGFILSCIRGILMIGFFGSFMSGFLFYWWLSKPKLNFEQRRILHNNSRCSYGCLNEDLKLYFVGNKWYVACTNWFVEADGYITLKDDKTKIKGNYYLYLLDRRLCFEISNEQYEELIKYDNVTLIFDIDTLEFRAEKDASDEALEALIKVLRV